MLCSLKTATIIGIDAVPVEVQVDTARGLPGFHLVGLPSGAVREGGVRVRAALENSGYDLRSLRTTVNLAPAEVRKDASALELPIALGCLGSRELVALRRGDMLFAGELGLDGALRPLRGALSLAQSARAQGLGGVVLPRENAAEAALVEGVAAYGVGSVREAAALVEGRLSLDPAQPEPLGKRRSHRVDFAEVRGQTEARWAAEVAAAGGHNLMLIGPPGSGKTMVARRMATILPAMTSAEAIETTKIHSVAGLSGGPGLISERPFRAPHHGSSCAGLVGGGSLPRPGEVSLAHNGVLFLDELPEFQRSTLEALRQPLEDSVVTVVRARQVVCFPARFMLVAAMNPCPCGYRGSSVRTCTCSDGLAERYRARISGPLLDRIDIFVHVAPVRTAELLEQQCPAESSAEIAARVGAARARQQRRFQCASIHCNAQMSARQIERYVPLGAGLRRLLSRYIERHGLSARALHRACRVARTLADLAGSEVVDDEHVLQALAMQQARWIG